MEFRDIVFAHRLRSAHRSARARDDVFGVDDGLRGVDLEEIHPEKRETRRVQHRLAVVGRIVVRERVPSVMDRIDVDERIDFDRIVIGVGVVVRRVCARIDGNRQPRQRRTQIGDFVFRQPRHVLLHEKKPVVIMAGIVFLRVAAAAELGYGALVAVAFRVEVHRDHRLPRGVIRRPRAVRRREIAAVLRARPGAERVDDPPVRRIRPRLAAKLDVGDSRLVPEIHRR